MPGSFTFTVAAFVSVVVSPSSVEVTEISAVLCSV